VDRVDRVANTVTLVTAALLLAAIAAAVSYLPPPAESPQSGATHPAPAAAVPDAAADQPEPRPRGHLFPPQELGLLSTPDRDQWQKPDLIMDELKIFDGAVVGELGAGGGWFTVRLARRVGPNGVVYAEDIQPLMIEAIRRRVENENLRNVRRVLGTPRDPRFPRGARLDAALIVDAFREMEDPSDPQAIVTLLTRVTQALKPEGRLGIVDFLPGGGGPGPAPEERVDTRQVVEKAAAAGLQLISQHAVPPFQFLLVFGKTSAAAPMP
jgi:ubiquinone/menaquinone biosynthesis C-methylase UbiE